MRWVSRSVEAADAVCVARRRAPLAKVFDSSIGGARSIVPSQALRQTPMPIRGSAVTVGPETRSGGTHEGAAPRGPRLASGNQRPVLRSRG